MTSQETKPVALRYLEELLYTHNAVPFVELFIPYAGVTEDDHAGRYGARTSHSKPVCHKQAIAFNNYDLCFESLRFCGERVEACWKLLHTSTESACIHLICTGRTVATSEGVYILRSIAGRTEEDWASCDAIGLLRHLGIMLDQN